MGWFSKLFGTESKGDPKRQATCVQLGGGYIIDLRPLPLSVPRVLGAIGAIATQVERKPEPFQVWVWSAPLLEAVTANTDVTMKLTEALYGATKRVSPRAIVDGEPSEFALFVLGSMGFEVHRPGLKLTMFGPNGGTSEIDPLEHLEKLRQAPRLHLS